MAWYPIPSHVFKEGRVEKKGGDLLLSGLEKWRLPWKDRTLALGSVSFQIRSSNTIYEFVFVLT